MTYSGPRRKSKLQKACEALDPRVRVKATPLNAGGRYYDHHEVYDGDGVLIGWNDGNEAGARWAWGMALSTLQQRMDDPRWPPTPGIKAAAAKVRT